MDSKLLDILCCPVTLRPLGKLSDEQLSRLNEAVMNGEVQSRGGDQVAEPLAAGLITDDGRLVYPVRDGVPVLLEEAGIDLAAVRSMS